MFSPAVKKASGVVLTIIVAVAVSYVTFMGLVDDRVNSAGSDPGNASDPTIDYGR